MPEPIELDPVDRLTVGTVGPVGQRTFLLQMRQDDLLLTVKVEKAQVAALAQYLGKLLAELARPGHLPEAMELEEPLQPAWTVGTIGIHFDEALDRFTLLIEEVEEVEDARGASARLSVTREQAAALAIRGTQLVEAGRPPCPLCGYPLDPKGHACPRTNGNRPPAL